MGNFLMEATLAAALGPWLKPALIFVLFTIGGFLSPLIVLKPLHALFSKTETRIDDVILSAVRRQIPLWLILAGIAMALRVSPLDPVWIARIDRLLMVAFILSVSWAVSSLLTALIRASALRLGLGATTLVENLCRIAVFGMGLLLILSNLGIAIAPLLTALGVGSLAVALALQDTLSNLFSGIYILVNRRVRVGDFIQIESGQKGYVADITWRATALRELAGNLILVPNAKLAQSIVTNYSGPDKEMAALVQVGVSYTCDLAHVERVTVETAREIQREVSGAVAGFEPIVRYHTFGDSSVNFTVTLRVKEYTDQYGVTHEFMKRLHERYRKESIEIPFPQRVVHLPGKQG